MKANAIVNTAKAELTYEKLKQYKGFENITEAEAQKQIQIIMSFAKVLQLLFIHEQQNENKEKIEDYEDDNEQFGT
ncbi:MAG: hypothetical protein ABIP51_08755 [Bacteroidia bacterium]